MTFEEKLDQSVAMLQRRGRVPVYGWFTEGFDTADLQDAKTLMQKLEA